MRDVRHLVEHVGEDVHRVGNDDIGGVRAVLGDLRGDVLDDVDVGLGKVHAGLAGLARNAGGDDDDVRTGGALVGAGVDGHRLRGQRRALTDVHGLAHSLLLIDVDDNDLVRRVLDRHHESDGGADVARSDDGDLGLHSSFLSLSP